MFRVDPDVLVEDGQLKLSGFDYEVSAEATLELQTGEAGVVLVSGRLLAGITRALPAQPVDLVVEGAKAVVTCGSARFTLLTMPVEDYPSLPTMPPAAGKVGSDVFVISGRTLADTAKTLGGTGKGMIGFSSAGGCNTTWLLDPEFPKYHSLLPTRRRRSTSRATTSTSPSTTSSYWRRLRATSLAHGRSNILRG
ncbi:hypothetical protein ACFFRH_14245 [Streptosporangium vulgare]|uniref:DNA polymerase III beta sliding clamp N-terminal domain-containing protein n=1 Tax=Streptosporangium vulgare TaxID=46190 RepID=A0ABV5TC43_9ACTN